MTKCWLTWARDLLIQCFEFILGTLGDWKEDYWSADVSKKTARIVIFAIISNVFECFYLNSYMVNGWMVSYYSWKMDESDEAALHIMRFFGSTTFSDLKFFLYLLSCYRNIWKSVHLHFIKFENFEQPFPFLHCIL